MGMFVWENNGNKNKMFGWRGHGNGIETCGNWNEWESLNPFPHTYRPSPDMKRLGHEAIELNDVT